MHRLLLLAGVLFVLAPNAARAQSERKAEPGAATRPVSAVFREVPLRVALQALFDRTGQQYAVSSDVPNVYITMEIREVPFTQAVRLLVREGAKQVRGLTFSKE